MITSGSGLERFFYCRASNVLQRTYDERDNSDTSRGREIHGHLHRVGEGMDPIASLDEVEERHRDAAAEIDLEDLKDVLGLSPEMTIAYNPQTDTARVLGSGLERQYEEAGLEPDEIPVTMDVIGLDRADGPTRGVVVDFKTGWGRIAPTHKNWQMKGGALALARAFDLDEVVAQLIYLREGKSVKRDRALFSAADLAAIAGEAKLRWMLAQRDRALYEDKGITPDATRGSWCKYCASFFVCPGQINLIREIVDPAGPLTVRGPLTHDELADVYNRMEELEPAWKHLRKSIYAAAHERPVKVKTLEDGTQLWLGLTEVEGNEKIDAKIAREVVAELLDDPKAADEISAYTISKDRIHKAVMKRVQRGQGAPTERRIYEAIKHRRGSHTPIRHEVGIYKIKPEQLGHQLTKTGT